MIAVAPVTTGAGHLLSTTSFDLPAWALLCWLLLRILRTGNERLWLAAGLVAGPDCSTPTWWHSSSSLWSSGWP